MLGLSFSYRKHVSGYVADRLKSMEKNLLLHKAVPQNTDAQLHCPSPDLDGLDLGVRVQLLLILVGLTNCITDFSQGHTDLPPKMRFHLGIFPNCALQK